MIQNRGIVRASIIRGEIINLPDYIKNNNGLSAYANVTVEGLTIKSIPNIPAITVANGVPKTVGGLNLPPQIEILLSDDSLINIDINWDDGLLNADYFPNMLQEQNFIVEGLLVNLPDWLNYYGNLTVVSHIKVLGKTVIWDTPVIPDIEVNNGAPKTLEGLHLPTQIEVISSDGSMVVDVRWDLSEVVYDPESKEEQLLTIFGRIIDLPEDVDYQGSELTATIKVNAALEIAQISSLKDIRLNSSDAIVEDYLPQSVMVQLSDGNWLHADVEWTNRIYSSLFDYELEGSLSNLPAHVYNRNDLKAKIRVYNSNVKYVTAIPQNLEITVEHAFEIRNKLPNKVVVSLDDNSQILADVNWYIGNLPIQWRTIHTYGLLKLPPNIMFCRNANDYVIITINRANDGNDTGSDNETNLKSIVNIEKTTVYVSRIQEIPESMPETVLVTLNDGNKISVDVDWYLGNPPVSSFIIHTYGILNNLPDDVNFSPDVHIAYADIVHMESAPGSITDEIDTAFNTAIDQLTNMKYTLDNIGYSLIGNDIVSLVDPNASTFDYLLALFKFYPIGRYIDEGQLFIRLANPMGKIIDRGVALTDYAIEASELIPQVPGIPIMFYNEIYNTSIQYGFSTKVMLGEFDNNYVEKAKETGSAYFDLGDRWGFIQAEYSLTEDDKFLLFDKPFIDQIVYYKKTIQFTSDPRLHSNTLAAKQWEYLKNTHGFKSLVQEGDIWVALP